MHFKKLLAVFLLMLPLFSIAQDYDFSTDSKKALKLYKKAEKAYRGHNPQQAVKYLEKTLQKDTAFIEAWLLLGDLYTDLRNYQEARQAYEKAIRIDPDFFPMIYYWLGNTSMLLNDFDLAEKYYRDFLEYPEVPASLINKVYEKLRIVKFKAQALDKPVPFNPLNLGPGVNTDDDEYVNAITTEGNVLIFTRRIQLNKQANTAKYKESIFQSALDSSGAWQEAVEMNPGLASLGNVGALTISPDGMYLFFVVCNSSRAHGSCDLFYMVREGKSWGVPANLGQIVNSGSWDSQPAFSSDGRTLYFASNRKGGRGSSDIYRSVIQDNGKWSVPENLGVPVNTREEEMAPFIHPDDNSLYFSSKGHTGMGGSDLFMSRSLGDGLWRKPMNLGYPINTEADEINIIVSSDASAAYISSDQLQGKGGFDIYSFPLYEEIRPDPVTYLKGKVYDAESGEPLQAKFELIELESGKRRVEAFSDDETGEFLLVVPVGRDYALNVSRPDYLFYSDNFFLGDVKTRTDPYKKDIPLEPIKAGKSIVLKNVFFDTDKYVLKPESKVELDKLVELLRNNPQLSIEIGGHTDNVGSMEYNKELSEKRAKAVYQYLIENKINEERLSYKGYSYSQPMADNESAQGRALNRRTEIKVVE